jgi:hypothetical protein
MSLNTASTSRIAAQRKPARSHAPSGKAATKPEARSRVTNGKEVLPGVDGRSLIARRYRDIIAAITVDQNGAGHLSEARQQLIRRFAAASVLAEAMEARLANGQQIDITEHALLCSTLCRVSTRIGLDRIARNITPTVSDYVAHLNDEQAEEVAD